MLHSEKWFSKVAGGGAHFGVKVAGVVPMRWINGEFELEPEDFEALVKDETEYSTIDFSAFDLECEEALKDKDLSFPVPEMSDSAAAKTAADWAKSPRLMLETITFRLNEILSICEARSFPLTVIQLKTKFIYTDEEKSQSRITWRLPFLIRVAAELLQCAATVEIVNMIQPTPFRPEILRELGRCMHLGDTPEFDRAIRECQAALGKLAFWMQARKLHGGEDSNEPFVAPRSIWSILTESFLGRRIRNETKDLNPVAEEPTSPTAKLEQPEATASELQLVSTEEVALKLQKRGITISPKTLKNSRKKEWGNHDGRDGNAKLYDWNRIKPIVEEQFTVKLDD